MVAKGPVAGTLNRSHVRFQRNFPHEPGDPPPRIDPVNDLAIVVPLKEFTRAKSRLRDGGVVGVDDHIREMATRVVVACRPRRVFVPCESDDVEEFARALSLTPLRTAATTLNEAVTLAYRQLSDEFSRVMIVHADLRYPEGLGQFEPRSGVTIVTDHRGRGTNVLVVPTGLDFRFAFGEDSARTHQFESERIGAEWRVVRDSPWRFDVDEPEDLL